MKNKLKQSGLSLIEMTVVMAVVAMLMAFSIPVMRRFFNSIEARGSVLPMISSSLASARATAAKHQTYAGVRFQLAYSDTGRPCQYLIPIIKSEYDQSNLQSGFKAVEGTKPVMLPETICLMDMRVRTNTGNSDPAARSVNEREVTEIDLVGDQIYFPFADADFESIKYFTDLTSFSILFSPSGKLIVHDLRMRNREGEYRPGESDSEDEVFNSALNVIMHKKAMFIQDDYAHFGLGAEKSRQWFVVVDRDKFEQMDELQRYDYLNGLDKVYINPYTGKLLFK